MGASKRKQVVNSHVRNFVNSVFADQLKEEGFHDVEDRGICWYRLKNDQVINTIIFNSCWNNIPLFLEFGYGIHPLFAEPVFSRNAYIPRRVIDCMGDNERFAGEMLQGATGNVPFSEDALVYASESNGWGIDVLNNKLLPKMQDIDSVEDCYQLHKEHHINIVREQVADGREASFHLVTRTFIDEAIYNDDTEMYPILRSLIKKRISSCSEYFERFPSIKAYGEAVKHYQKQDLALSGGREEYLEILEQRRKNTLSKLYKKYGIVLP